MRGWTLLLALVTGCSCALSHAADASVESDAGVDAGAVHDAGDDAGMLTSCEAPLRLEPGELRSARGSTLACRAGDALAFFAIRVPAFSQMEPLLEAALPQVIAEAAGPCDCMPPYHESTAGSGELELIAVSPSGVPTGYAIASLEPGAACTAAPVAGRTAGPWARLDRAGARIAVCDTGSWRPLYFRIEDASATTLVIETDAPVPLAVGTFVTDCENRFACDGAVTGEPPLRVSLPPGEVRYAFVADTSERRDVSVRAHIE